MPTSAWDILSYPLEVLLNKLNAYIDLSRFTPPQLFETYLGKPDKVIKSKLIEQVDSYLLYTNVVNLPYKLKKLETPALSNVLGMDIFSAVKPCKAYFYQFQKNWPPYYGYFIDRCAASTSPAYQYVPLYFRGLQARHNGNFLLAMKYVHAAESQRPNEIWTAAEESNLAIILYGNDELGKRQAIHILSRNKAITTNHYLHHYFNGFLYMLEGQREKAIREYIKYAQRPYASKNVFFLIGSLDRKHRLEYFERSVNRGNSWVKIYIGAQLLQSAKTRQEGIYWLRSALRDGQLFAAYVYLWHTATSSQGATLRSLFDSMSSWLGVRQLTNDPYAHFLLGVLRRLEGKLMCGVKDTSAPEFIDANRLFQGHDKYETDPFAQLVQSYITRLKGTGIRDTTAADYHAVQARQLAARLPKFERLDYTLLAYLLRADNTISTSDFLSAYQGIYQYNNQDNLTLSLNQIIAGKEAASAGNPTHQAMLFLAFVDSLRLPSEQCLDGSYVLAPLKKRAGSGKSGNVDPTSAWLVELARYFYEGQNDLLRVPYYNLKKVIDYNKAFPLFFAAAARGYVPAEYYLARMYSNGQGVPQNCTKARYWLNLARANKFRLALITTLGKCPHETLCPPPYGQATLTNSQEPRS